MADPARDALVEALRRYGMSYAELSHRLGRNPTYIQQYVTRGSPRVLPDDIRQKVSVILGVPEQSLTSRPIARRINDAAADAPPARDLPLLGVVSGGSDRIAVAANGAAGMIERPAILLGVVGAYAVEVIGDSQAPRLQAGDICYVNPHRGVRAGNAVVAQFDDGTACLKEFVAQDEAKVVFKQHSPAKIIEFPRATVTALHKIVLIEPN